MKLENDLRHAQSTIADLNSNLSKSNDECRRLEKDWEAYKLRVKNMLHAKDSEIKSLQQGMDMTEDTKELMDQIDLLKLVYKLYLLDLSSALVTGFLKWQVSDVLYILLDSVIV